MKRIIASDIHFSHRNILQYCPQRVDASFTGDIKTATEAEIDVLVDLMNENIISNWNEMVEPDDEVFILGDVAMGKIVNAPPLIRRLNGRKHLVDGNHDTSLMKLIQKDESLSDLFVWVKNRHEMAHSLPGKNVKKNSLFFSHFPHASWPSMNQGVIHFHGHLHGSPSGVTGRIFDVGIDTNNLRPYLMDDVVEKMLQVDLIRNHH